LSMVVPAGDSAYYNARGSLAVAADSVLPINSGFGFHPSLPKLAARYAQGKVGLVMGVDYPNPDLSHFTSMLNWMTGQPAMSGRPTGWVGRWLDSVGNPDGLSAVAVGSSVPLHMVGARTSATALPCGLSSQFAPKATDIPDTRLMEALSSFAVGPTGLGPLGDALAANNALSLGLAAELLPMYSPALPTGSLANQMALAARLINANLGIRVVTVTMSADFDVHSDEVSRYPALMAGLDQGIDTFYSELGPEWSGAVTLMTFSEFGRRVKANSSGTDHGTASTLLVIGDKVKGGILTEAPSLTNLDANGNLKMTTDYRSVYATVISDWLQGDPDQVMGPGQALLPLFSSAPSNPVNPSVAAAGTTAAAPARAAASGGYWLVGSTGTVYPFSATPLASSGSGAPVVTMAPTPDGRGGWVVRSDGAVVPTGTAPYVGNLTGKALSRPIVGAAPTPTGKGLWLVASDGGVFSFGDAAFHGSTGAERLVRPVVGMAATSTGNGYWLVASDGGLFSFGDAGFHGSTGAERLTRPVVGMASTPTGNGYWLVASDGGVFCFGDAGFHGSTGAERLARPIVGLAASPTGNGYWLVASDGGVFSFGDAGYHGGLGGSPPRNPIVGVVSAG
jgi:uncharacterized protein (DUF1501 family)